MAVFMNVLLACTLAGSARAEEFLAARISPDEVQYQLHHELRTLLGHGDDQSSARLALLQSQLEPLFAALPKNADGGLDHGVARYALHRFFVHKHGWHVRGLEAAGAQKWSDNASIAVLEDHIPSYVLQLFEQQHGSSTGTRELAVLAATLEDVIHSEAVTLLSSAYTIQERSEEDVVQGVDLHRIVETYLLHHLMPIPQLADMSKDAINYVIEQAPNFYTGWVDTITWVQDLRDYMQYVEAPMQNPFISRVKTLASKPRAFNFMVRLVEKIGEDYGQYQNLECRSLKNALLDLSDGSGRVRLAKFYRAAMGNNEASHFSESPDYLRHLGVLDESDPRQPAVILTNYLYAKANCVAASGLYAICCIDECEDLIARLEKSIASPLADPGTIAELVTTMASETVAAPRSISTPLRQRLDDIARQHGGSVPLHGRLFTQWMHHAYPNECRYPHLSGSLETPLDPLEWMSGRALKVSESEIQAFMGAASQANASEASGDIEDIAPTVAWSNEEELVAPHTVRPMSKVIAWLRLAPLLVAMVSLGAYLVRLLPVVQAVVQATKGGSQWFERSGAAKSEHLLV